MRRHGLKASPKRLDAGKGFKRGSILCVEAPDGEKKPKILTLCGKQIWSLTLPQISG